LREVTVDYHHHARAVFQLAAKINRGDVGHGAEMLCTGIGSYTLTLIPGAITRDQNPTPLTFDLRDPLLHDLWSIVSTTMQRDTDLLTWFLANRASLVGLGALQRRYGHAEIRNHMFRLATLFAWHDARLIPGDMAKIWPADVPMDLRGVESCGRGGFLHALNVCLTDMVEMGQLEHPVPRRHD